MNGSIRKVNDTVFKVRLINPLTIVSGKVIKTSECSPFIWVNWRDRSLQFPEEEFNSIGTTEEEALRVKVQQLRSERKTCLQQLRWLDRAVNNIEIDLLSRSAR